MMRLAHIAPRGNNTTIRPKHNRPDRHVAGNRRRISLTQGLPHGDRN